MTKATVFYRQSRSGSSGLILRFIFEIGGVSSSEPADISVSTQFEDSEVVVSIVRNENVQSFNLTCSDGI